MPDDYSPFDEWKFKVSGQRDVWQEAVTAALEGSAHTLRATMLINGGAAIALLAFLGNVIARDSLGSVHVSLPGMRWALMVFLLGVASSALAYALRWGATYADAVAHRYNLEIVGRPPHISGQHPLTPEMMRWGKRSLVATGLAVLFGLLSLVAFVWGGIVCYRSIW